LSLVRRLRLRRRIVVDEIASELDARAKDAEKVRRGAADADLLGLGAGIRDRRATRGNEAGHVLEELGGLLAQVAIIRRRERPVVDVAITQLAPYRHQPLRVGIRQRAQQHGVDDAEDGRAGADPQCDGDGGDGREAEVLAQASDRVGQVLQQRVHTCDRSARHVPCRGRSS
jgi:hypothetical protein